MKLFIQIRYFFISLVIVFLSFDLYADAPVLSHIETSDLSFTEGGAAKIITNNLDVSDPDSPNLESATVSISGYINGEDVLSISGAPLSGSFNASTGVLSITATASLSDYQDALRSVRYKNTNTADPSTTTRTISFVVNDGTDNSNIETRDIQITAVNDAPILSAIGGSTLTYIEDSPALQVTSTIVVTDSDNTNLASAIVAIDVNYMPAEDSLQYTPYGLTVNYVNPGNISASGSATKATYQNFLRSIKYKNFNHANPDNSPRRVSFTVNDGFLNSNTASRNISITPVNDPPVASGAYIQSAHFYIGELCTAKFTYTDPEEDPPGTHIFRWDTAATDLGAGRGTISGNAKDTTTIRNAEGGNWIRFIVRPFDDNNLEGVADTSIWYYINAAPEFHGFVLENVTHPGVIAPGETVRAGYTYFDKEGNPAGTHTYQWYVNNTAGSWTGASAIPGATNRQYLIAQADTNKYIAVEGTPRATSGSTPGIKYRSLWYLVSKLPSATISGIDSICNNGSDGELTVVLTGTAPWSFTYKVNNGTPIEITGINVSPYHLQSADTGTYILQGVKDSRFTFGNVYGTGKISYYTRLSATLTLSQVPVCSGDTAKVPVTLTGVAPWSITYRRNGAIAGTILNITTPDTVIRILSANAGTYTISPVTDKNCSAMGTGSTVVSIKTNPKATMSGDTTICPAQIAPLKVALTGNGPWTFYYKRSAGAEVPVYVNQDLSSYNYTLSVSDSGTYRVTRVVDEDQEGCASGTAIVHNFAKPTATISGNKTICEGTTATFNVPLTGFSPWSLSYRYNSETPKQISNITQNPYPLVVSKEGSYVITAVNDKNCPGTFSGTALLDTITAPKVDIILVDTIFSRTTLHVPISFKPVGGSYAESDKPNAIQPFSDTLSFWPILADTAGSPHWIRYKYTDPGTACVGKDSLRVFVIASSGAIQVDHEKSMNCFNDDTIEIFGVNIKNKIGNFTISPTGGLINSGNNKALLLPSVIQSGIHTVTYTFDLYGVTQHIYKVFSFEKIDADFRWDNECFGTSSTVGFYDQSKEGPEWPVLTGNHWNFTLPDTVISRDSPNASMTFTDLVTYPIEYIVTSEHACTDTVRKDLVLKSTISVAESAYSEDFSGGLSNWSSHAVIPVAHNSWTFGTPTGETFNAPPGQKAWYTNIVDLQQAEQSYVISPCFSFSGSDRPMIKMDIWRAFASTFDGAVLQYTIDNGASWFNIGILDDGIKWYNSYQIQSMPGNQSLGWSNIQDAGWNECRHALDNLIGQTNVRFRMAYAALAINYERDGIAFDNVWIGERSKKILIEHFTNAGDNYSKLANSELNTLVNKNAIDVIDIQYHLGFPGNDTFYILNPLPVDTRELFYNISNVPYAILDGGRGNNPSYIFDYNLHTLEQTDLSLAVLEDNKFDINIAVEKSESEIGIDVNLKALEAIEKKVLTLHVAVVERVVKGITGDNGETRFESVFRDEVPSAAGTSFFQAWSVNTPPASVHLDWTKEKVFDENELRIVVYIQDEETQEVYQAAILNPNSITGIKTRQLDEHTKFIIYPNPAVHESSIWFKEPLGEDAVMQLFDFTGKIIYRHTIPAGEQIAKIRLSDNRAGVYIVTVMNKNGLIGADKLIILNNK